MGTVPASLPIMVLGCMKPATILTPALINPKLSMSLRVSLTLLLCLSWLAFAPATEAQYVCQVRVPATHGPIQNAFIAFSSKGNYCTAATLENADTFGIHGMTTVRIIFQHSTDGGWTWQRQDPGLPQRLVDNIYDLRAIDQIDSLHAIAVGDTGVGLVLRTSDGGQSWQQLNFTPHAAPFVVSFANAREGLIVGADSSRTHNAIFTTTDGGDHWSVAPLHATALFSARAYGHGMFRFFKAGKGTVYTTRDNFQTIDSTKPIFDTLVYVNGHVRVLDNCQFGSGDTMVAYGEDMIVDTDINYALIWRSSDAGQSWQEVLDTNDMLEGVTCVTDIDRDTVLAGCNAADQKILFSPDRGATWRIDTLLFDAADAGHSISDAYFCRGIGLTPAGTLVGAFGYTISSLIVGHIPTASVRASDSIAQDDIIFPNPATDVVKITTHDIHHSVVLIDVVGREVLRGVTAADGSLTLDISRLPAGVYYVSDGTRRARFVKE
jgi:photosystem II stability/assembly factor-like uncharacterized protein